MSGDGSLVVRKRKSIPNPADLEMTAGPHRRRLQYRLERPNRGAGIGETEEFYLIVFRVARGKWEGAR